ncbi:MAG TPA: signal peptide peptidase SppA [Candidatus Acidoferrales bacterium]|nr:signal peptide peptidase SppA [Candidatus Acidoferrales bacterium]
MKRIVAVIALIYVIAAAAASGQDILVNPQNQKYLFTAGTDETQAFLYNPACLGLYSRGGVLDGYYFYPTKSILNYPSTVFHDIGIFGQAGKFGLAYRNAENSGSTVFGIPGPLEENLNQYSVGLGFGNQGIAVGASLSLTDITGVGSRWLPAIGLIVRPDRYISLGAAYHNFSDAPFGGHAIEKTANLGVGIRPFGTDFLTLSADLITPVHNNGFKIGIDVEPIPGLKVYGIYDLSGYTPSTYVLGFGGSYGNPDYVWTNSVSIGVSLNFSPHIHIEGASSYQRDKYAATYGRIMVTSQEMPTILFDHRIAEIVIRGNIPDERQQSFLFFKSPKNLLDYIDEIKKCGDDLSIDALILKIYPFSTHESFFALSSETQELADAVEYVRSKGKNVYAYLTDDSGVNEVYLASAADKIYMAPVAFISGYGVNMDLIRLKGLFDKLHISWNAQTAGKYKSTFHTIYTDSASPEQAKLIQGLVDDIYSQMIKQIEVNRNITMDDSFKAAISGILSSREAARLHLIDQVAYYDEFKKDVSAGLPEVDPSRLCRYETRWGTRPEIAVIGVYGNIVTGESAPPSPFPIPFLGSDRASGSETVAAQIKAAAEDADIKAIVLRVNSGGGSALASDEIYNAINDAEKKKPVIASFGNVAASGGYYVAAGVRKIFAEPATLTGSIGVVIAFPVLTDFLEKDLGSNVEEYRAGRNSDILSPFHRWDDSDLKYVDKFLNETYNDFKTKVAEGRKLSMDRVEELAQGKVYTGIQAKSFDLIDEYGGLDKAIQYAADAAGISRDYTVRMFMVPGIGFPNLLGIDAMILKSFSN